MSQWSACPAIPSLTLRLQQNLRAAAEDKLILSSEHI